MNDKPRLFHLNEQPPALQLFTSIFIITIAGTLLFYLFVFAGSLVFGTGMAEMLSLPLADAVAEEVLILKYLQVSQQVALFAIPALVIAML
ncbi:MAG: hypothetical protein C0408_09265, partial [Odoribacter sp.]|nr:hypothetical protein [Odoribacter sp.]